jgi:hypothetical protein
MTTQFHYIVVKECEAFDSDLDGSYFPSDVAFVESFHDWLTMFVQMHIIHL